MGAGTSCPSDFDQGFFSCRMKCPPGFKYAQDPPQTDKCVLFTDNSKSFPLRNLPMAPPTSPVYDQERQRVATVLAGMTSVAPFQDNAAATTRDHDTLKSQYAGYAVQSDAGKKIKEVSDTLKMPRPHVQPNEIQTVRTKILHPPNMNVIQTALFTILIALVVFLVIPTEYASGVAFLTLCIGTSVGIYLSTR
jgi:hypothetical protein